MWLSISTLRPFAQCGRIRGEGVAALVSGDVRRSWNCAVAGERLGPNSAHSPASAPLRPGCRHPAMVSDPSGISPLRRDPVAAIPANGRSCPRHEHGDEFIGHGGSVVVVRSRGSLLGGGEVSQHRGAQAIEIDPVRHSASPFRSGGRLPRVGPPTKAGGPARSAELRWMSPRHRWNPPTRRRAARRGAHRPWRSAGSDRPRQPRSRPWSGARRPRSPSCGAPDGR